MTKYTISKEFGFSASHQLTGLEENHPCSRLHGHNYIVKVTLGADNLDEIGFVTDYRELEPIKTFVDNVLDHRHLNNVVEENPTAECLAFAIYQRFADQFPELISVSISETPKTWATYTP